MTPIRKLLADRKAQLGFGLLAVVIVATLIGPPLLTALGGPAPKTIDTSAIGAPPSATHPLGTTDIGQDVLAQLLVGGRGSLFVGFLVGLIGTALSAVIGVGSGYLRGPAGSALGFSSNLFLVLPTTALVFVIAGYVPNASPFMIALILALLGWAGGARALRSQTLVLRRRDFVIAMELLGVSRTRVVFRELMPHLTGLITILFLNGVIGGVLAEAGLRFLGIGDLSAVTWGGMIGQAGVTAILAGMWWWIVPPGIAIALLGVAAGLINGAMDEIANPRLHRPRTRVPKVRAVPLGQETGR